MTLSHNYRKVWASSALILLSYSGEAAAQNSSFGKRFAPPAPKTPPAPSLIEEHTSTSSLQSVPRTSLLRPETALVRQMPADARVRRAEEQFEEGKRHYEAGRMEEARAVFDAAIEGLLSAPENLPDRDKLEKTLETMAAAIHRYDVNGLGSGESGSEQGFDKAPLEDILELTFPVDPALKPRVREQLQTITSQLPLEMNDSVLSYINFFSGERGRRTLLAGLRRAGKYKPMIQRILQDEGVPQELIYLAQAESGFLPRAVSHKAATGMWQFVRARGREYGLTQTGHSDDRLDPEKATRSAARHLRDLHQKFGDWYLAIAAYNCGDGCVDRAVQRTGYADFWELRARNAIPRETTNYVPIILAMTIMHKNAKDYGLENIEEDAALEWETYRVEAPTHLTLVADLAGRPVSELRELNPSLLSSVAPKHFELRVPNGTLGQIASGLDSIPEARRSSWRVHRVGEGDTLASIAKRYNMGVGAIAAANSSADADVGDMLVIPTRSEAERVTKASPKKRSSKKTPSRARRGHALAYR